MNWIQWPDLLLQIIQTHTHSPGASTQTVRHTDPSHQPALPSQDPSKGQQNLQLGEEIPAERMVAALRAAHDRQRSAQSPLATLPPVLRIRDHHACPLRSSGDGRTASAATLLSALRCRVADVRCSSNVPPLSPQCPPIDLVFARRAGPGTSAGSEEKQETLARQRNEGSSPHVILHTQKAQRQNL